MRSHLPVAVPFGIHLQGADAERILSCHFHVDKSGQNGGISIEPDIDAAKSERLVSRRSFGYCRDVLLFVFGLAAGVGVL
jgi:hypothetical protein